MSGIAGIFNLDGAPADQHLLHHMTRYMACRGPDDQQVWVDGPVGFGHALLRTTSESISERGPCSLEGQVWITADARIDARAELANKLGRVASAATDPELILHAYEAWGEGCLEHLLGDFSFAIWDGRNRRLFCARDHFGVKPFYYAHVGTCFIFSNTLNCVRMHPDVSDELNDLAIGDFLLFGFNQELSTTTFAAIQRLPPAHCLTLSQGHSRVRRYWTMPIDTVVRFRRQTEYVERFRELLTTAVKDRLRTDRVVVLMSGGLDSTSVAATAKQVLSRSGSPFELRARTAVYRRLIPDEEGHYAAVVAEALRIPIHYQELDGYRFYERWSDPQMERPEPYSDPMLAASVDEVEFIAAHARVALTGLGGDHGLYYEWEPYVRDLLRSRRFGRLTADVAGFVWRHGRIPLIGGLARRLGSSKNGGQADPYPRWLNPDFEARCKLRERHKLLNRQPPPVHPLRPKAYHSLRNPFSASVFESYDPAVTHHPVEFRQPFLDVRLMRYLLSIPALPWCVNKYLLREAMRGILPELVRRRGKTPVMADPILARWQEPEAAWQVDPAPPIVKYVNWAAVPMDSDNLDADSAWMRLMPWSLNYWLRCWALVEYKSVEVLK